MHRDHHVANSARKLLIAIGLISLSVSMVTVGGIVLWGLRPVDASVQT